MNIPIRASGRSGLIALLLTLLGLSGAHRFYLGKYVSGMLIALPIPLLVILTALSPPTTAAYSGLGDVPAYIACFLLLWVIASLFRSLYDFINILAEEMTDAEGLSLNWIARSNRIAPKRSQRVAFVLCLLGFFGAHRFYTGQVLHGLILLLTLGGLGFLWALDMILILTKLIRDHENRPLNWDIRLINLLHRLIASPAIPRKSRSPNHSSKTTPKRKRTKPKTASGRRSAISQLPGKLTAAILRPTIPMSAPSWLPWNKSAAPTANRSHATAPSPPRSAAGNSSGTTSTEPVVRSSSERRLPVYLMVDTSASMRGEPISAVNNGIRVLIGALLQDPYALETVHMSILTVGSKVSIATPLTPVHEIQPPEIAVPRSGAAHLGRGLKTLAELLPAEVHRGTADRKADWSPFLFLMTRGRVSDRQVFDEQACRLREFGFKSIVGCLTGPNAREDNIESLCDRVVALDTMDAAGFSGMFRWDTMVVSGRDRTADRAPLPPPPREIKLDP